MVQVPGLKSVTSIFPLEGSEETPQTVADWLECVTVNPLVLVPRVRELTSELEEADHPENVIVWVNLS